MKKNRTKKAKTELFLEKKIIWVSIIIVLGLAGLLTHDILERKEGYPIKNVTNKTTELAASHCLDDFCIRDMTIYYSKKGISSISGYLINNSDTAKDACVKIKFQIDGQEETEDFNTCYYELEGGLEVPIETYFNKDQKELVYARDYTLDYLTDEELETLYNSRDEELKKLDK